MTMRMLLTVPRSVTVNSTSTLPVARPASAALRGIMGSKVAMGMAPLLPPMPPPPPPVL
ncbi:hypothetical protein D3C84_997620 [compost metagenome]